LLTDALRGGNHLTRKEVAAVFASGGIEAEGMRLGYLVSHAELDGLICSGARKGSQHTYALLDERAPSAKSLPRDVALAELTRRYFTSHGPATVKDLRWWSSLTVADIATGIAMAGEALTSEVVDGVTYWSAPSAEPPTPGRSQVYLLQAFDEYTVAYSESKYVVDLSGDARVLTRERPVFNHVVLLDTQVAGHWKRTLTKRSVVVEAVLYKPFDDEQTRSLHEAADRHAEFLGRTAAEVMTRLR
jgi:hypothetical protein